jgi:hypothetical protein
MTKKLDAGTPRQMARDGVSSNNFRESLTVRADSVSSSNFRNALKPQTLEKGASSSNLAAALARTPKEPASPTNRESVSNPDRPKS